MWKLILICLLLYPMLPILVPDQMQPIINLTFSALGSIYIVIKRKKIKITLPDIIIMIFLLNITVSSFLFSDFINGLTTLSRFLPLFILFYLARSCDCYENKSLIRTLVIGGVLLSIYSLRSFFVLSDRLLYYLSQYNIDYPFATEFLMTKRAFSPFITPNLLAGYLVMIIFLSCGLFFKNKTKTIKILLFTGIMVCLLTLFYTKSVGGWITLLVSSGFFFIITKKINKKSISIISLIVLLILGIIAVRSKNTLDITKPYFSIQQRISYWSDTAEYIKLHPLLGVGLENFSSHESLYTHNSFLQIWAEMGLSGIITWLAICIAFIGMNFRITRLSKNNIYTAAIFCAGLSFIIHNVIDFSFYVPQVSFIWWILLGLIGRSFRNIGIDNHESSTYDGSSQGNKKRCTNTV